MNGYTTALCLCLLLGPTGAASAATAVLDFSDSTKTVDAAVVNNPGGAITPVREGNVSAAKVTDHLAV